MILILLSCETKRAVHVTANVSVSQMHSFACRLTQMQLQPWSSIKDDAGTVIVLFHQQKTRTIIMKETLSFEEFGMETAAAKFLTTMLCEFAQLPPKRTNFWMTPVNKDNYQNVLPGEYQDKIIPALRRLYEEQNETR